MNKKDEDKIQKRVIDLQNKLVAIFQNKISNYIKKLIENYIKTLFLKHETKDQTLKYIISKFNKHVKEEIKPEFYAILDTMGGGDSVKDTKIKNTFGKLSDFTSSNKDFMRALKYGVNKMGKTREESLQKHIKSCDKCTSKKIFCKFATETVKTKAKRKIKCSICGVVEKNVFALLMGEDNNGTEENKFCSVSCLTKGINKNYNN